MAQIKGTNLAHIHAFVKTAFGEDGLQVVRRALAPETQAAFDSFVAVSWYPASTYVEMLHAVDATLGENGAREKEILRRAGAYAAEYDLTRIHRVLFRFANPGFVLERSTEIWGRFFDTGHWKIVRPTSTSVDALLTDFGLVDRAVCTYLEAYLRRLFELVGAKDVEIRHPECRARGGKVCKFLGSWT
jgi:V4R domain